MPKQRSVPFETASSERCRAARRNKSIMLHSLALVTKSLQNSIPEFSRSLDIFTYAGCVYSLGELCIRDERESEHVLTRAHIYDGGVVLQCGYVIPSTSAVDCFRDKSTVTINSKLSKGRFLEDRDIKSGESFSDRVA